MRLETFKCDVCGVTKGETNHWWRLAIDPTCKVALLQPHGGAFFIEQPRPQQQNQNQNQNQLQSAYPTQAQRMEYADLCGQDCVNRKLSEVMK